LYRRGTRLAEITRDCGLNRQAIYRIAIDARIARLTARKVSFHDDPLYHERNAFELIRAIVLSGDLADGSRAEPQRVPKNLPPYLADLYRTPLLNPKQERSLFLLFNYHKYRFVTARRRFDPEKARKIELDQLERHARDAAEVKNRIVLANLRLVVSVARKHLRADVSLMELVSEGNLVLLRAVESFDVHRNTRFSTYATFALMKGFARTIPQMRSRQLLAPDETLRDLPDTRGGSDGRDAIRDDDLSRLLERLDDDERRVISDHYGLGDRSGPATLDDLSRSMGLSRRRVREIERAALCKLREATAGWRSA
jgi:RNA polymerase sigma factor (sigma-70 family)